MPISTKEVFKLTDHELKPELFKFGSVTLESEKYVCVKDIADCAIIDMTNDFGIERKPMKAESLLMHWSKNMIAIRNTSGKKTMI